METIRLTDRVTVLHGAVNMGLVRCADGLVAVDTGLDKQAAKQLQKAALQIGLPITAVINTHAHADHFGGNAYLLAAGALPVYAPAGEAAVIRRPEFEPQYLWQGASPLPCLQNMFLQARPSPVDVELEPGASFEIGGCTFTAIALPGHAVDQCGILVEGVLFAADAYFDADVAAKHGIVYMVDYDRTLASARAVADVAASWYVPGHGVPTADPAPAVEALIGRHEAAYAAVIERCATPATLEDLVELLCSTFGLTPANAGAYVLLRTPTAAYVSAGVARGTLQTSVEGGRLTFTAAGGPASGSAHGAGSGGQ